MSEPRRYTIKIDVEVRDQDDFANFQPDTVTARATDLGMEWVTETGTAIACSYDIAVQEYR